MMKPNRAKCALCGDIVESCFSYDEAVCRCGEVHVKGGELQGFKPSSGNWSNILAVDDIGNRICTDEKDSDSSAKDDSSSEMPGQTIGGISKQEMIQAFADNLASIEKLPNHVLDSFVTTRHFLDCMLIIANILKRDIQ